MNQSGMNVAYFQFNFNDHIVCAITTNFVAAWLDASSKIPRAAGFL
jgi:hypothetical protein